MKVSLLSTSTMLRELTYAARTASRGAGMGGGSRGAAAAAGVAAATGRNSNGRRSAALVTLGDHNLVVE
mgnify:CR=1 FL=1